ncbi:MAG: ribosome small subunit-dependent GTPase A [Thermoanaerobacteraceae bacterium]|nr:ribosome small subunit-dependent GTPase A [Thermoanaerobacteraceae bacterium]
MNILKGRIIKGIAGFYYVKTGNGIIECRARGKFRIDNIKPIVGDIVDIATLNYIDGYIIKIYPRKNELARPLVSNVDQAVIVFSIINPKINKLLLDKMIVVALLNDIEPIICINKIDLCRKEDYEEILNIYSRIGYRVFPISYVTKAGIKELKDELSGKTSFFSGPSGVGKSSIINCLQSEFSVQTGELSERISRGKHTTRCVELIPLNNGGFVLDTPGFTSLNVDIDVENLKYYFAEFEQFQKNCRFSTCIHENEPCCSVKKAVEEGLINKDRYLNYLILLKELRKNQKRRN